jgi:hypothetical protein
MGNGKMSNMEQRASAGWFCFLQALIDPDTPD